MNENKNTKSGHKKVISTLKKYSFLRSYKVLSDVEFDYKGETITIDNILIGFFGIIVITDLNYSGEVYIEKSDKSDWLNILNNQKTKFQNPIAYSNKQMNALKIILREEKIGKVPVENLVVFTDKLLEIYKPNDLPIISIQDLSKYLHQPKYDKDNECDVPAILTALNKHSK